MSGIGSGLGVVLGLLLMPCLALAGNERTHSTTSTARHPTSSESGWEVRAPPAGVGGLSTQKPPLPYPPGVPYGPGRDPASTHYWSEKCVNQRISSVASHTTDCDNPAYSTGYGPYPPPYPRPYPRPPYPPAYGGGIGIDNLNRTDGTPLHPPQPFLPTYP